MRVRFLKDAVNWAGNRVTGICDPGAKTERFEAGKVYDLSDDQAEKWINLQHAEEVATPAGKSAVANAALAGAK